MPTIDEKRTIAENLRYEADYPGRPVQYMEQFIEDLRQIIISDGGYIDYSEMFNRLADLIDPAMGEAEEVQSASIAQHMAESMCDIQRKAGLAIDRDALLKLADEMERSARESENYFASISPWDVIAYAKQIRKALGVEA